MFSDEFFMFYLSAAIIVITVPSIIGASVFTIVKAYKTEDYIKMKCMILTLLCMTIAAVSWLLNMGWLRFVMTYTLIPFVHAIIFFLANLFSAKYMQKSKKLKAIFIMFCITYLLSYLLLADGGDIGEMYVFFGLIHNNKIFYICNYLSGIAVFVHIVLLILQITEIAKIKKCERPKNKAVFLK